MLVDVSLAVAIGIAMATVGFIVGALWAYRMVLRTINEAMQVAGTVKKKLLGATGPTSLKAMAFDVGSQMLPEILSDAMKQRRKGK